MIRGGTWAAAMVAVAALAVGCTQAVPGLGKYSSGAAVVADADVPIKGGDGSEIDRLAGNAIADIQKFWTEQMPKVFDKPYKPVKAFYAIDPDGNTAAPCTDDAADVRGNAFYCPSQDIVAWDRKGLFPQLKERFGDFLVAMVLAHEWGHAIQKRTTSPSDHTIVLEAQADCYAGAWSAYALRGGAPHFQIERPVLDNALAGYLLFRDPVGSDQNDKQAHGSGFDRISGFQDGYEKGTKFCTTIDDDRTFVQVPFTRADDEARKGNLPFDQSIANGPTDLGAYWQQTFTTVYQRQWTPVTVTTYGADVPTCGGQRADPIEYCPDDDKVYAGTPSLRQVYDKTGDFGPMSLIAVAYGTAARRRLGQTISGERALLGSICFAGAYAGDLFNERRPDGITLSPGDLDEAIRALLDFAGRSGFFEARGTTGFDRVGAFRKGFTAIAACG